MKKILLILFICSASINYTSAQDITKDGWDKLIEYLDAEDWKNASIVSLKYLKQIESDTSHISVAAILRYMYITSLAGMMNDDNKLSKDDAIKKLRGFKGAPIMLPFRLVTTKMGFNYYNYDENNDSTLSCTNSNKDNTSIFSFDKITLEEKFDKAKFDNKVARVGGYLKEITVEGLSLPRFRLIIVGAFLEVDQ